MPLDAESMLQRLVAQPSVSSTDSTAVVETVLDLAEPAQREIHQQVYDEGRKRNLLLTRGPAMDPTERPGLTLAGHLDVVPAAESDWKSDPWRLTDTGDRWVARGSCDMKGFVALALDRFQRLDPSKMRAPLAVLLTADEEVGSIGAQHWVADREVPPLPRQTLIGEPTELRAVRLHKGHLRLRLTLSGQAAHSGYPQRGRSAIEPAGAALVALADLRRSLAAERHETSRHFAEVPFVTLNIGRIAGGVATNVIADRCVVDLGLRPLPGVATATLLERVEAALAIALGDVDWSLTVDNDSPSLLTEAEAPLNAALSEVLGQRDDIGVGFSSDGGTLARTGADCVLFGPGSIEVAHRANEYLPKDQFARAGEVLDWLIERFCGTRPR